VPFYFDKPINLAAVSISHCVVIIPASIEFFNCGFGRFTIFIDWFFVEYESAVISATFLGIISEAIDIF
jgi:hypothetical protein